jgi:hypothetical protein
MIKAVSYSRLDVFETCKFRARLQFIDRVPEGDKSPAADRGTRIHQDLEHAVRNNAENIHQDLVHFVPEIQKAAEMYEEGLVAPEEMWCFNSGWQRVAANDWDNIWLRIKTDLTFFTELHTPLFDADETFDFEAPKEIVVVDFKSGKRFGNEVKHQDQCSLYALGAFMSYPKLEKVRTELWYGDINDLHAVEYTRRTAMETYFKPFNERLLKVTATTDFPPQPSRDACKWCPYSPWKGGQCSVGIRS